MKMVEGIHKTNLRAVVAVTLLIIASWSGFSGRTRLLSAAALMNYVLADATSSTAVMPHRLPDTGQTASFTSSYGEDSDYTINPPSLTDSGDGIVTDNVTGLVWQKSDAGEMTWENAAAYAAALRLGGYSDWRLPTNHELFSVLNHSGNPALDPNYFTMSGAEYWWTSETMAGDSSRIWAANAGGGTGPHAKNETSSAGGSKRFHARCVRGGFLSTRPKPSFKNNGDGTVTDLDTGLIWQQAEAPAAMNWESALNYAENLSLSGYSDWRLPNVKELQSLNDETIINPSIDQNYFPGAVSSKYWSATTLAKQSPRAWYVDFQSGIVSYDDKAGSLSVRCVRAGAASAVPNDSAFLSTELLGRPTANSLTVHVVPARNMDVYFEYGLAPGSYSGRTNTVSYAAGTPIEATLASLQPDTQYCYRIRSSDVGGSNFAAGEEHTFHTRRAGGSTFTVAIQADPHMDENTDPAAYRLTMQNMLAENPDFMVDLGDTFMSDKISTPTYPKVMDRALLLRSYYTIAGHSVPLFLALGNHEGEWGSRLTGSADNLPVWDSTIRKLYYPNPLPDSFYSGSAVGEKYVGMRQSYYAWEWGNALFVVLDPYWNVPQTPELSGNWSLTLGRRQYDWLKQTLEGSKASFKFVFCHNLVGGWNKNGTGPMRGGVEAAKYLEWGGYNLDDTWGFDRVRPGWAMPIHELLVKNNVTIFFHGHDHFYGKQDMDGIVYQEVPQPGARNTELGNRAASYGYTEGRLLGGTGYLRMRVSPSEVTVDYVQTWTPVNETGSRKNRMLADSYTVIAPQIRVNLTLPAGGRAGTTTAGSDGTLRTGYANVTSLSGSTPYGTAVFRYTQNEIVIGEAAVPASPPTTSARLFVDYGVGVAVEPALLPSGPLDVNTGLAVVNPANNAASIRWTLRDRHGQTLAVGHSTLDPGNQRAVFVDQIQQLVPDFVISTGVLQSMRFGTLQVDSDQALSVTSLRMVTTQRGDTLYATIPIADLTQSSSAAQLFFPQLADGGGYTTSLILINTSDSPQSGMLRFYGNGGFIMSAGTLDSGSSSSLAYSIPPGGISVFQTDGLPSAVQVGSVQLTPDSGSTLPVAAGIFGYTQNGVLVTESGIASATPTTHARVFIDTAGGHDSGLAIAAIDSTPVSVTLRAYQSDGITATSDGDAILNLPGNGHEAGFLWQWISGLPANFQGVLDLSAVTPFAALTLRSLTNERGDFMLTTFPVADMTRAAPSPLIFPHLADGGGYRTEFIFLNSGNAGEAVMNFFGMQGSPLSIAK
jgi:hypothetical protein